ncbi:ComEA family DNA-binding protein [Marinicrinis lubricantis]|uniref:ComEA family DNA-binding protein n=1 Tax=Marinicrinis lubricantis TaxID=2086470 RepID=A0ABW1IUV6_9BACL
MYNRWNSRILVWIVMCLFAAVLLAMMMWPSGTSMEAGDLPINSQLEDVLQPEEDGGTEQESDQGTAGSSAPAENKAKSDLPDEQDAGNGKIKINEAGIAELDLLPGIGPSKAQAIIDYRNEHGPFKAAEDLLQIKGIGEKTLAKFKDMLEFD